MHDLSRCDDATLLRERERFDEAFAIFYRRHVAAVLGFCASRGLQASEAADVTAEAFAAALLARRRYRPERGEARVWLLGIAAHKLADGARRRSRAQRAMARLRIEPIALTERDVADFAALRGQIASEAATALQALPDGQRAAVHARVICEEDYATIGRRLGLTEVAARRRVSRGLAALRARLQEAP